MLSYIWGEKDEPSHTEAMCNQLMGQLIEIGKRHLPSIEEDVDKLINQAKKDVNDGIEKNLNKIDVEELYETFSKNVLCYLNEKITNYDASNLVKNIKGSQALLHDMNKNTESDFGSYKDIQKIKIFKKRVRLAKQYGNLITGTGKKEISILALGPSQVGKTALVKRLFNLNDKELKLKGGLKSDTTKVETRTKIINGILVKYSDSPGFFDSGGKDKENLRKIITYLKNNDVDIVLWVIKINDIVFSSYKTLLINLTRQFGKDIWNKTIIVLTHANDIPPDEYFTDNDEYFMDNDEYQKEEEEKYNLQQEILLVDAWKRFTNGKKSIWRDVFNEVQRLFKTENPKNIPVVLIENSRRKMKKINGIGVLRDGTPILETFMTQIFKLIKKEKSPYVFLAMAGNCDKFEQNDEHDIFTEDDNDDCMEMTQISALTEKQEEQPTIQLTEHQISLNQAVNNYVKDESNGSDNQEEGFWSKCILF